MKVACGACGAQLKANPKLAGATISCPRCGARVELPATRPRGPAPEPPAPARRPSPYTLSLFGVQVTLFLLGLTCFAGAFFRREWEPPEWSYFQDDPVILIGAGIALMFATGAARTVPVLAALAAALVATAACGLRFYLEGTIDASRVLALAVTMLALWLALQHRRRLRRLAA